MSGRDRKRNRRATSRSGRKSKRAKHYHKNKTEIKTKTAKRVILKAKRRNQGIKRDFFLIFY